MILYGPSADLRLLHPGEATGEAVVLSAPLSFWGGVDRRTGVIIDVHHPQHGTELAGRVLVMRAGRGSSSGSSVLAEVLRNGAGPAAVLLAEVDLILSLGVIVAAEVYDRLCPVAVLSPTAYEQISTGDRVHLQGESAVHPFTADKGRLEVWRTGAVRPSLLPTGARTTMNVIGE